ncbi:hypothetical protein [Leptospira ilyithenensis]|uniref:Uncharacterized protein n=1 Tax=Leptospira ilyithenensis TaxID=2484901 RepID=A0A4R9LL30_9LEPT|nr:hypothetical protein [Leptospira ilyithenensis]TGN06854.1 hypothetical protein EHS11_17045 [Leptospira ilyithenensis]
MKVRSSLIFLISLSFVSSLIASELYKFVAWKNIPDASGYQIQIKDTQGKVVVDKKIEKNYYSVQDIGVGDYFVRTAPLNIFKKPVVWSPWKEMEILISEVPTVDSNKDKPKLALKIQESEKDQKQVSELEIQGDHFLDVTEVEISKEEKKLPIIGKQFKSDKRIDVTVDTTNASAGDYDLTIVNPFQKPQTISKFLKVEEKKEPVVEVPKEKSLNSFTYPELMAFLNANKAESCPMTGVPGPTLSECYSDYIVLNQKTNDAKDIFAFYKLISENQSDRFSSYTYFEGKCKPVFRPAKERIVDFLGKRRGSLDPEEIFRLEETIKKIDSCSE